MYRYLIIFIFITVYHYYKKKASTARIFLKTDCSASDELKLIRDMRKRNPKSGLTELWHRLRKRGYTRRVESLYRFLKMNAICCIPQLVEKHLNFFA